MVGNLVFLCLLMVSVAGDEKQYSDLKGLYKCYDEPNTLPFGDRPQKPTTKTNALGCCIQYNKKDNTIKYNVLVEPRGFQLILDVIEKKEGKINGACQFSDELLKCCCRQHLCNSNEFARIYREKYFLKTGVPLVNYLPFLIFVVALIFGRLLIKVSSSQWIMVTTVSVHDKEVNSSKYVNMRGAKVVPFVTRGELQQIKDQIRVARSLNPPQLNTLRGKPDILGVYTYNTSSQVTNRQLGSVPISGSKDDFHAILDQMLSVGPREMQFGAELIIDICNGAINTFRNDETLVKVPAPAVVYGDIHGQYSDLLRFLHINGFPPTVRCVFLGDYVDRGRHSLETILFLFLLKICMPYDVYLCRGNHEDPVVNRSYSFYAEIEARVRFECPENQFKNKKLRALANTIFAKFSDVFAMLPISVLIGEKILGMHGGISPRLKSFDDILKMKRPLNLNNNDNLACDMAWSDPTKDVNAYEPNFKRDAKAGIGYLFGYQQVEDVCKILDIDLILRGHQAPMPGYERFGSQMITVFTAPGYRTMKEVYSNFGASIQVGLDGGLNIVRIGVDDTVRLLRELHRMDKGEVYTDMDGLKLRKKEPGDEDSFL